MKKLGTLWYCFNEAGLKNEPGDSFKRTAALRQPAEEKVSTTKTSPVATAATTTKN